MIEDLRTIRLIYGFIRIRSTEAVSIEDALFASALYFHKHIEDVTRDIPNSPIFYYQRGRSDDGSRMLTSSNVGYMLK
jgi:hypothetical protein